MRSAVILAALAVGTCARVIEKEVYVTEWTTTTVTETVTQWPTNAPSTAVLVKQDPTKPANAAIHTADIFKKTTVESVPPAAPTPAPEVEPAEPSSATTWSSATEAEIQPVTSSAAPVATSSATSTTAAATAAPSAVNSYQESVLHYHNIHRSDHSASALSWSDDLAQAAHTLASRCVYGHDT
jgi:outer membrane biosynthesis protein TonB